MVKSNNKLPYLPLTPEERAFVKKVSAQSINATLLYYTSDHADRVWFEHQYNRLARAFREDNPMATKTTPKKAAPAPKPAPATKPKGGKKAPAKKGGKKC